MNKINQKSEFIFIQYPTKFEKRDLYISRSNYISEALEKISYKYSNVQNVRLNESQVLKKDNFPYHYSIKTNTVLKREMRKILEKLI